MKKLIFTFLVFAFSINIFLYNILYSQPYQPVGIPDVMNKINVLDMKTMKNLTIPLDSFPIFPSFPVHILGSTFEGGLYCNMDNDPEMEIVYNIGYTIQAYNIDGTPVPGWPKTISTYALEGAPAFGDIDGDGFGEIIVTNHGLTSGGFIYAFKLDGTPCTGFPINHGYSSRTPVLADVNNDGKMEIIVNKRIYPTGQVYIYKGDGTILSGWPKNIGSVPASSCAVGDIDNDNQPEIIAEAYYGLYAWKVSGDSIPGFPYMMPNGDATSYSSPVLADLNGDNYREIIFGTHVLGGGGYVYVLNKNGTVLSGWPKPTNNWIYGPPAVGYIDEDNILDIAVGDQVLSTNPSDQLYAWNKDGVPLTGFPVSSLNAINNQVVIVDIDGDNKSELIIDDNSTTAGLGKYLAFNHDGTPCAGWPLQTTGTTFFSTPCIFDFNNNGILDMIGVGIEGSAPNQYTNLYVWNTGAPYHYAKNYIPMWQYNCRHNGVYGDVAPPVGVRNITNSIPMEYKLEQNYPNPFNPMTNIKWQMINAGKVKIVVFDILGKEVATLVNEKRQQGSYEVNFDGSRFSSGIYFYQLRVGDFIETKKMSLIK